MKVYEIVMNILIPFTQFAFPIVVALILLRQNRILKQQIASQDSILQSMKLYAETFDPNKVKEYVNLNEDRVKLLSLNQLELQTQKMNETFTKEKTDIIDQRHFYQSNLGEVTAILYSIICQINRDDYETIKLFIENKIPSRCKVKEILLERHNESQD